MQFTRGTKASKALCSLFQTLSLVCAFLAANHSQAEDWLDSMRDFSEQKIRESISRSDTVPGTVIASPSRQDPDYYFHWVRDAGLVTETIARLYQSTPQSGLKFLYKQRLLEYADLARTQQKIPTIGGMGEAKFNVDGSAYNGSWARPQNDGPALRAISLIQLAQIQLNEGAENYVREKLYDSKIPTETTIKADLEFVSHHWREQSFDLWEEIKGDHFYTRMVQRRALLNGFYLAKRLGDAKAAEWYWDQTKLISAEIEKHWSPERGILVATLNRTEGVDYKSSGLDTAVILGVLHGDTGDGFMAMSDWRVQSTLRKLEESFIPVYPINWRSEIPGVAIGRYPEDRYNGTPHFNGGNPWVLCTLALAEAYYTLEERLLLQGNADRAHQARLKADLFVRRVQYHTPPDLALAEQMNRDTGFMTSAPDLTWNYHALLSTLQAKKRAKILGGK